MVYRKHGEAIFKFIRPISYAALLVYECIYLHKTLNIKAMVLIQYGSSEHVAHVWSNIGLFQKNIKFNDYVDVTECLWQIEIPDILHVCAQCSELPSNIGTMMKAAILPICLVVGLNWISDIHNQILWFRSFEYVINMNLLRSRYRNRQYENKIRYPKYVDNYWSNSVMYKTFTLVLYVLAPYLHLS